ncbi:stage II sporulation protein E [Streptomyces puniciscabiei]|uniref:Stage II sporulation protein E n=2 Tax=Streptomyces puniciscabiei TaxID=164348 RepID=A0A542UNZ1_9ACTN|nr:PP2C family protein-serine/threonine phosphatase [Streptomyces puniciscabiei]TQL00788.1 stage II sporulation protein E [Streptomyces puniciscabiei]
MRLRGVWRDRLPEQRRGLLMTALALIVAIAAVDIGIGTSVHLGPLLVIAPTLTAAFAGPRLTALVGALAEVALVIIAIFHGGLTTTNHVAQLIALAVLSALVVFVCYVRERHARELSRLRSVAETAQRVLLRPPPRRIGPLRVAWLYLAAEDEAQIGGDLLAVARADHPCTRVLIGDVRGHGLASVGEASVAMSAFREGAHRYPSLPELATAVEESICRNLEEVADTAHDAGEHFITAIMIDIPDQGPPAEMLNCGHPPPLLIRGGQVTALNSRRPAPPWGLHALCVLNDRTDRFALEPGDMLLLYTDGVIEARSPTGAFYPLAERVASFPASSPDALLHHIHRDLLAHSGEQLTDDAAFLIIERIPSRHLHRPLVASHADGRTRPQPAGRHGLAR